MKDPPPRWERPEARQPDIVAELKRRARPKRTPSFDDAGRWSSRGDWWRVAAMVAAVLCGSALMVFALVEWAAGM